MHGYFKIATVPVKPQYSRLMNFPSDIRAHRPYLQCQYLNSRVLSINLKTEDQDKVTM